MKSAAFLAALLASSAASSPWGSAQAAPLPIQEFQGVRYVSGGVGQDERDYLQSIEGNFNLRLLFAGQDGTYMTNVQVVIQDRGRNTVLDTVSDGPLLYVALPGGSYTVTATVDNTSRRQPVTVEANRLRHVDFFWKGSETYHLENRK